MAKPARILLRRLWPPRFHRVTIRPISVGGFLQLLEAASAHSVRLRLLLGRAVTDDDILRGMREPEFLALAEIFCPDEPAGFFRRHLTLGNVQRLLRAIGRPEVHDWTRLLSCLNLGDRRRKAGSVNGDIVLVCRQFPGLTPVQVRAWPMHEFLDVVDGLSAADATYDPTSDPEAEPLSAAAVAALQRVN